MDGGAARARSVQGRRAGRGAPAELHPVGGGEKLGEPDLARRLASFLAEAPDRLEARPLEDRLIEPPLEVPLRGVGEPAVERARVVAEPLGLPREAIELGEELFAGRNGRRSFSAGCPCAALPEDPPPDGREKEKGDRGDAEPEEEGRPRKADRAVILRGEGLRLRVFRQARRDLKRHGGWAHVDGTAGRAVGLLFFESEMRPRHDDRSREEGEESDGLLPEPERGLRHLLHDGRRRRIELEGDRAARRPCPLGRLGRDERVERERSAGGNPRRVGRRSRGRQRRLRFDPP